jgi:hypothetical protein
MKTLIQLRSPSSPVQDSQTLEIPKHLPPIVRDVAESLALRDPELAARYLQTYQQPRHERTDLTGSTRSHLP